MDSHFQNLTHWASIIQTFHNIPFIAPTMYLDFLKFHGDISIEKRKPMNLKKEKMLHKFLFLFLYNSCVRSIYMNLDQSHEPNRSCRSFAESPIKVIAKLFIDWLPESLIAPEMFRIESFRESHVFTLLWDLMVHKFAFFFTFFSFPWHIYKQILAYIINRSGQTCLITYLWKNSSTTQPSPNIPFWCWWVASNCPICHNIF